MKRFLLRIQTYLRKLAGVPVADEMPLPQSDIEKSLYEICKNNPNGIMPGVQPSGTISITENGTYDVAEFAEAEVNIPTGGAHLIASGTWTGDGDYKFKIPVGKKMPQTDFLFTLWVDIGTEFPYDNYNKFIVVNITALHRFASFDLSTDGEKRADKIFYVNENNDGTIGQRKQTMIWGIEQDLRTSVFSTNNPMGNPVAITVTKDQSGFSISADKSGTNYKFVSGMSYNWELLYIGNDPTNDIVEVA